MMNKRNCTILLVDDDPHTLKVTSDLLESKGYQVWTALSGEQAFEAMEQDNFDLVITDLFLNKLNGLSVLKKAKELDPDRMVIIRTGSFDVRYAIEAIRLDVDDYLLKSFSQDDLLERVSCCFKRRALKRQNMPAA